MLTLHALFKGLDGINESAGEFWDLVLFSAVNGSGAQIYLGSGSSFAAVQTLAGNIFKASLTWTTDADSNQTYQTSPFTD